MDKINVKELTTVTQRNAYIDQWLKNNPTVESFTIEENEDETIVTIRMSQSSGQNVEKTLIHWEGVFDGTYEKMDENLFQGWQSTFTGDPIPIPEMEEWQKQTIENILRSKSKRILELGSGSGLIVSQILPHPSCHQFLATDLSAQAVTRLQERFGTDKKLQVKQGDALGILKELALQDPVPQFDLVILNSVIQYFANVEYLEDVMIRSLAMIAPGGRLFIGDIRNLDSFDFHLLSLELQTSTSATPLDSKAILEKLAGRRRQTFELLLSPDFFHDFHRRHFSVSHIVLETHRGKYLNEMQRYRFNVSLVKKGHPGSKTVATESLQFENLNLETLSKILKSKKFDQLYVKNIPTVRLGGEEKMLQDIKSEKKVIIEELKAKGKTREKECICLGELEEIGTSEGYRVIFVPKKSGEVDGLYYLPSSENEILVNYAQTASEIKQSESSDLPEKQFNDPSGNKEKFMASSVVSIQLKRSLRGCPLPMPTLNFI